MGLMEKALQFKKNINKYGRETLIDKIQGPAETEIIDEDSIENVNIITETGDFNMEKNNEDILRENDDEEVEIETAEGMISKSEEIAKDTEVEEDDEIDDDLFLLPEDDIQSPIETLQEQKEDSHEIHFESSDDKEIVKNEVQKMIQEEDTNPLGLEDEPILANINDDKAQENNGLYTNNGIIVQNELKEKYTDDRNTIMKSEEDIDIDVTDILKEVVTTEEPPILKEEPTELAEKESEMKAPAFTQNKNQPEDQELTNKFSDFQVLYELIKEIEKVGNTEELFDVILFSIMGQIGVSSSSIIIADQNDKNKWVVACSRGVKLDKDFYLNPSKGILCDLKRNIIDIDEYKDNPECDDIYYQLISIDTRLLSPLSDNEIVFGALILGEKLNGLAYTDEERDFILSICSASSVTFNTLNIIDRLKRENSNLKRDLEMVDEINHFQDTITVPNSMKRLEEIIITEFRKMGIESYAIFLNDQKNDRFIPIIVEKEDFLSLQESNYYIELDNPFITYVDELKDNIRIEDIMRSEVINGVFSDIMINRMSICWIYPFKIGIHLIGFITLFRSIDRNRVAEIDKKLVKLTKIIYSVILNIKKFDVDENKYIDNVELILKRINSELINAKNLTIPLTIVLFSIRNFKRYYNLFGNEEANKLIDNFVNIIKLRLGDNDFSVRFDRHKILIVLPGKNKKYAIPLANTIRNEIVQGFKKKEMQILVTFLTAEYPEDGDDLYSLLDSID